MAIYCKATKILLSFRTVHTEKNEIIIILKKMEWMVLKKNVANYFFFLVEHKFKC